VVDRNSKRGGGVVQTGFSPMDFVNTVPFPADAQGAPAPATPSAREQSSLFLDDLSDARPAHVLPASADAAGTRQVRLDRPTPSEGTARPAGHSASAAGARSGPVIHPKPETPSRPRSQDVPVVQGRLQPAPRPDAPKARRAMPAQRRPKARPRRVVLLVAATAALSIVALTQAGIRPGPAPSHDAAVEAARAPAASMSRIEEPSHVESASAAESIVDTRPVQEAAAAAPPPAATSTDAGGDRSERGADTSPEPGGSASPKLRRQVASQAQRRATPEAIAASVAAAQSKADAFLHGQGATSIEPARDPATP